jgi:RNA polymerase sigma-70 factor (ECF subfamily)
LNEPVNRSKAQASIDLVERCNRGDDKAWEELHAVYGPLVMRMVGKYASYASGDREDLFNDVFERLIHALKNYDPGRSMEGYIVEIARRVRIDHYRRRLAQKRGGGQGGGGSDVIIGSSERGAIQLPSNEPDQESAMINKQDTGLLRAALRELSQICRELLSMRYERELSYREISGIMSVKESTLRVRAQRCMISLKEAYERLDSQDG